MTKKILGLYIFILGLLILIKVIFINLQIGYFFLFFIFTISIHMILIALCTKRKKFIIPGTILFLFSIFIFFYCIYFINFIDLKNIWPIIGLIPSISFIFYYIISVKKSLTTIIPGIFICILSLVMLLITLGIFKIKFLDLLLILISSMLIIVGLFFLFNKKSISTDNNKNNQDKS
jgi:hypothetical protein